MTDAERKAAHEEAFEDVAGSGLTKLPTTQDGLLASIAISLKRIADAMETEQKYDEHNLLAAAKAILVSIRRIADLLETITRKT